MQSRPLTISIVGWFLIAFGLYWLFESLRGALVLSSPESKQIIDKAAPHTQEIVDFVLIVTMAYYIGGSLFDIAIGMFVLGGANAARIIFVIAEVLNSLVNLRFFPRAFVLDTSIAVVAIILLFLPSSNRYFAAPD